MVREDLEEAAEVKLFRAAGVHVCPRGDSKARGAQGRRARRTQAAEWGTSQRGRASRAGRAQGVGRDQSRRF